jgi:hypothetical protein
MADGKLEPELTDSALSRFCSTFGGDPRSFYRQRKDGGYSHVKRRLELEDVRRHVDGTGPPIGFRPALNSKVKAPCYDLDNHNGERSRLRDAMTLRRRLRGWGLDGMIEKSGTAGSYHIWIRFAEAVSREDADRLLKQIAADIDCETLPKGGKVGGCICYPYYALGRDHRRVFLDASGKPLTFFEFLDRGGLPINPVEKFERALAFLNRLEPPSESGAARFQLLREEARGKPPQLPLASSRLLQRPPR